MRYFAMSKLPNFLFWKRELNRKPLFYQPHGISPSRPQPAFQSVISSPLARSPARSQTRDPRPFSQLSSSQQRNLVCSSQPSRPQPAFQSVFSSPLAREPAFPSADFLHHSSEALPARAYRESHYRALSADFLQHNSGNLPAGANGNRERELVGIALG